MKTALLSLGIAFFCGSLGFAQTVTTDPVGFTTVSLPQGGNIVVPTLLNAASYVGNATIAAASVTPSASPNWTPGAFAETSFPNPTPNYPVYYVEVIAGTYQGYSFDIVTNDGSSLTVPSGDIPAALVGQTVQVAVRKHITLDIISTGQTGLTAYVDAVNVFNSDGTTSARYFDGASWVGEDYVTPAGQTVIYPGTGFTISTAGPVQLLFVGPVKTTSTAVPVYKGNLNVVGPLSPASGTLLTGSGLAPVLTPNADTFSVYSTDGRVTLLGTYYSDGTNILNSSHVQLAPNAPDAIPMNSGVFLSASSDTVWIIKSPLAP